ncbi:MAG: alanyl-tRNA editing protein AlaXM [Candidatus Woesearchaeota archaeon]|nr:alanyl-tRNA editing protein AlaXM [Candidatus Woesearchaeota archaeon]
MPRALYLEDSYLKEFDAEVVSVKDEKFVVLDNTGFYPTSGGQPFDTGKMICDGKEYPVVFVGKFDGAISHQVEGAGLKAGDKVHCVIDWDRRYKLMRMHTAAHIFMQVLHNDCGALGTGNELGVDESRIDFSLDNYDPEQMQAYIAHANEVIAQDLPVSVDFKTREEAMQIPGITKLAKGLPEHIQDVRIVSIGDFDVQADGGTHVHSTKEVGKIVFVKAKNKGKGRKRAYFRVD